MAGFILRRLAASVLVLLAASFLMYVLAANSGDPLLDLRGSSSPNKDQLIAARVAALDLDVPAPLRWFLWLGGVAGCVVGRCDLGVNLNNAEVTTLLPEAMLSTVQLVTVSFVLALLLGVTVGIVTALRQYSGFDISITFLSFFLYSLPSFLVAVLLKEFIAIGFNDFLQSAAPISVVTVILLSLVSGLIWQVFVGGALRRRLVVFVVSAAATGALLTYLNLTDWFRQPGLGPVGLAILLIGTALATTAIAAGLGNRRALITAGIAAGIAYVCFFALQGLFDISTMGTIIILGIVAVVVGIAIGFFVGGQDRRQAMRVGGIVAFVGGGLVVLDRFMQSWSAYNSLGRVNHRPIATVGAATPNLSGDMWIQGIDSFTHLLLPTIALLLISFASYTRYARAGLLEVLDQDYIRTARAKGLSERTVVVRHAFRNMLIPIATLVATDLGALLGGAVITENVFAISGMGALFNISLKRVDLNPIMGYFLVIAIMAIVFNIIADLAYAALDPRVRVRA